MTWLLRLNWFRARELTEIYTVNSDNQNTQQTLFNDWASTKS